MEFQLEVKKYKEQVAELESTVVKLQRELTLSQRADSDATEQMSSKNDTAAVTDQTNAVDVEDTGVNPQEQVSVSHC